MPYYKTKANKEIKQSLTENIHDELHMSLLPPSKKKQKTKLNKNDQQRTNIGSKAKTFYHLRMV